MALDTADGRTETRQYSTLREWAYRHLREMIVSGELAPGETIREGPLSDRLEISKSPLREALRQLHQEGLIVTISNKGSKVASLTEEDIREIYQLREYTEALAGRLACQRRTPEQIAALRANVAALAESVGRDSHRQVAEHDIAFHLLLAQIADHRRLLRIQENLQTETLRLVMRQFADWGEMAETDAAVKHAAIVDAIEAGDADLVEARIREHIRQGKYFRRAAIEGDWFPVADGHPPAANATDDAVPAGHRPA